MKKIWKDRSGKKTKIKNLTDSHLLNIKNFLERFAKNQFHYYLNQCSQVEQMVTGEYASLAIEDSMDNLIEGRYEQFLPEIYYYIKEEINNRRKNDSRSKK